MIISEKLFSGTSGLQTPIAKRDFPDEFRDKSRLSFYASLFNSIEINSSFYKLPQEKTVARWAAEVPDDFKFTFKLGRNITHNKELQFNPDDIGRFMQTINAVYGKRGCVLVQLPPGRTVSARLQLERMLALLQKENEHESWKIMVEFRHKSWYADAVYDMLAAHHADMVFQDLPNSVTPFREPDGNVVYLRFHGPEGRYKGSYSDALLAEYAGYTTDWLSEGKTVYVYFNNTAGDALNNLMTLNDFVAPASGADF